MRRLYILILFLSALFLHFVAFGRNLELTRERIAVLTSPEFHGRGYVDKGMEIAADFLADEFEMAGLKSFGDTYFQPFDFAVNTFPNKLRVTIDKHTLTPGDDYMIGVNSPKYSGRLQLFKPDSLLLNDTTAFFTQLNLNDYQQKALVVDYAQIRNNDIKKFYNRLIHNNLWFGGIVELISNELAWSVGRHQDKYPTVQIRRASFPESAATISLAVNAKFEEHFAARNLVGYVEGDTDDFIVLTAHYDHLGRMGKKVFMPGAQDNASGTAMVLDLADYFAKHKPRRSVAFILFAGEEAGLLGSSYFVEHPLIAPDKIKAVVNLDLVGTGDDGFTMVNGSLNSYADIWELFNNINDEQRHFDKITPRGAAANSDHYPFYAKGMKAIFIYTTGGHTFYHNPKDKLETLSFAGYKQLFDIIVKFVERYE